MTVQATSDPRFQSTVTKWINANGEILALFRFHAAAGDKSFEVFRSIHDFNNRLSELPPRASVIVFREPQLPLRGIVDDAFVAAALRSVADGNNWLIVSLSKTTAGSQSWYHYCANNSHVELENELRDDFCWGKMIAVGPEPDWLQDTDMVCSAVIPEHDGTIRTGVY